MSKRPRFPRLLRAKADDGIARNEPEPFRTEDEQFGIEHIEDAPFEPIPDSILYMFSLFEAA